MLANIIVTIKATHPWYFDPNTIAWCAQVTEAPEDKRRIVFKSGIFQGSKVTMYAGGQTP